MVICLIKMLQTLLKMENKYVECAVFPSLPFTTLAFF